MDLRGKKLLLLGGTNSWEEIKEFADREGIILTATGPYPDTILKRISQEAYDVDAMDDDGLYNLIVEKKIDGVFVGCNESVVPHAINATQRAGKPCYCNNEQWELCANKAKFKAMCKKHGVPVTEEYDIKDSASIPYPVITKPADSCGSQGFSICNNEEELKIGYDKALPFSRTQTVLVEKYMPYDAVIIHYTLAKGEVIFSGMSDKKSMKLKDYGSSVMALQLFPSEYVDKYLKTINDKVIEMFKKEGMHEGPIWIEAFNNNGEFTFNEMGYRFGGSMTYYPVRYFYGFDQLEMMLKYSLCGDSDINNSNQFIADAKKGMKYSILPLHVNPGTIDKIVGEKEIKEIENLYAYVPIHFEGDEIKKTGTVNQVMCYLHILYDTFSDLKETIHKVLDKLSVKDERGEDLLFCLYDVDSLTDNEVEMTMPVLMLSQEDLLDSGCFSPKDAFVTTEKALLAYDRGRILYPDKICQIFDAKSQSRINGLPATLLDEKICGIKWVSVFPENPTRFGTQNLSAMILLSEIEKGYPLAFMDGTLCSNLRTATVGAVAASYLARKDSDTIGFIGAGEQAKMHFVTFKNVFPAIKKCKVASRSLKSEKKFIDTLSAMYPDVEFIRCDGDYKEAVSGSHIIITAISGQEQLLKAEWIENGMFYCHVGGLEDEYGVPLKADKIVCDNWDMVKHRSQTISRLYNDGQLTDSDIYADLHELVAGKMPGRERDDEFIYFNSVGLSFVDTAISYEMYKKAVKNGKGVTIDMQKEMIMDYEFEYDAQSGAFVRKQEEK